MIFSANSLIIFDFCSIFISFRYIKLETTGKSVPGVKTKILSSKNDEVTKTPMLEGGFSPDIGEIAGWGRNVFMGYLNKENETKEVMTEGNFFFMVFTLF